MPIADQIDKENDYPQLRVREKRKRRRLFTPYAFVTIINYGG